MWYLEYSEIITKIFHLKNNWFQNYAPHTFETNTYSVYPKVDTHHHSKSLQLAPLDLQSF
jgi:hypothetical protein